ncbi:hypothetical protein SERLA73DRAFT_130997 [Serpula lacrymans var. lacrymans S7.3]|uniref:Chalcone isomerase domain-containing protein n=2 Tax=Serpula lacrymans var. lacrymans TaxID=341189 RepID=F8PMA2_SERL3|nr:uncharacterized protein SERLADRAFT_380072 [Serpula lacrymans var. lacrymans S7.9]EGO02734.1 hypothetical protein SERLA73DRAFT_130997 [Serpula lacrymans var. lacrymans S7.3]EGO28435.1 hypothetical protein SERLADRAFT_380072 [Serpula lacrymans var. lacrymans S7.9]
MIQLRPLSLRIPASWNCSSFRSRPFQTFFRASRTIHVNNAAVRSGTVKASLKPFVWGAITTLSIAILLQNTVHLDAVTPPEPKDVEIDPATSISFPKTLQIPSKYPLPKFSLVGVGVRTVSFLRMNVYSVGFYADLANPDLNIPRNATPEEKIDYIVRNTACVLRIIPTRSTSFSHMRDGFVRALMGRMQLCVKRGSVTAEEEAGAQSPIRKLKSIFPSTSLKKHTPLDVLLTPPTGDPSRPRALIFRDLGTIENDWVANEFFLAYFEGSGISPPLKQATVERLESYGK